MLALVDVEGGVQRCSDRARVVREASRRKLHAQVADGAVERVEVGWVGVRPHDREQRQLGLHRQQRHRSRGHIMHVTPPILGVPFLKAAGDGQAAEKITCICAGYMTSAGSVEGCHSTQAAQAAQRHRVWRGHAMAWGGLMGAGSNPGHAAWHAAMRMAPR